MSDSERLDINGKQVVVKIPLEQWVHDVAHTAAKRAAKEVIAAFNTTRAETCPMRSRIGQVGMRLWLLIAVLTGLGVINVWSVLK